MEEQSQGKVGHTLGGKMDINDENFRGDSGHSGEIDEIDHGGAYKGFWRAMSDLASQIDHDVAQNERRHQILAYVWATVLFFGFSTIAFYLGFWYAMNHGVCP